MSDSADGVVWMRFSMVWHGCNNIVITIIMSYITIIVYIMYYYITVIPMCYNIVIYYTIIVITIIMA